MTAEAKPIKVFYSYSHEDKDWREKLAKCLAPLKRRGLITDWYDRCILPGSEWQNELDQHLKTAQLILLLISPDFIASDYCYEVEMKRALEKHDAGEARVIPIILRHADLEELPFQKLEGLPTKQRPITDWPDSDAAFRDIAQGIRRVVLELQAQPALGMPTAELRKHYLQIMAEELEHPALTNSRF